MKYKICLALLGLLITIGFVLIVPAQSSADWGRVESAGLNTRLVVETKSGRTIKGKLLNVNPTSLSISRNEQPFVLQMPDVARVYRARKGSRIRSGLIGAGIGAAAGIGISAVYIASTKGDPLIAAGGLIYGLPAGAAAGALIGGKTKKGVLIYEAR